MTDPENTPTIVERRALETAELEPGRVKQSFQDNGIGAVLRAELSDGMVVHMPLSGVAEADDVPDEALLDHAATQRALFANDQAVEA
jgi:hypothetical protein